MGILDGLVWYFILIVFKTFCGGGGTSVAEEREKTTLLNPTFFARSKSPTKFEICCLGYKGAKWDSGILTIQ